MKQEDKDKEFLLKDLCARLPYGVMVYDYDKEETREMGLGTLHDIMFNDLECKPYLRPLSSMTEEDFVYLMSIRGMNLKSHEILEMMSENFRHPNRMAIVNTLGRYSHSIDWLNKNMFDYRNLIPKGLAIAVTADNNPYKD